MRKVLLPGGAILHLKDTLTFRDVAPILAAPDRESRFLSTLLAVSAGGEEGGEFFPSDVFLSLTDAEDHMAWSYLAHEGYPELLALDALYPLDEMEPEWTLVSN